MERGKLIITEREERIKCFLCGQETVTKKEKGENLRVEHFGLEAHHVHAGCIDPARHEYSVGYGVWVEKEEN